MHWNSAKRWILMSVLAIAVAGVGVARADGGDDGWHRCKHEYSRDCEYRQRHVAAPEIDPASAASALALLAGGIVVLRGRRALR